LRRRGAADAVAAATAVDSMKLRRFISRISLSQDFLFGHPGIYIVAERRLRSNGLVVG
jgi:hypothetical protein